MSITDILDKARDLLAGEPARAIGYGAGVIVYLVARALGSIPDVPFEDALILTAGYVVTIGAVIESIRRYVYSAPTVDALVEEEHDIHENGGY